jgi:hypothetical protein
VKLFETRRQKAQLLVIGALFGQGELTTTQLTQRTGLQEWQVTGQPAPCRDVTYPVTDWTEVDA